MKNQDKSRNEGVINGRSLNFFNGDVQKKIKEQRVRKGEQIGCIAFQLTQQDRVVVQFYEELQ